MKIRVLSDLHFEFHRDGGRAFVAALDLDFDVLVLAGDISNGAGIRDGLDLLCAHAAPRPVVFVTGNHEFYGSSRERTGVQIKHPQRANFVWLDDAIEVIDGVRFLGTPLWFDKTRTPKTRMNDWHQIKRFGEWVYRANANSMAFLDRELREGDVLVTHYLPSPVCVHSKHRGSPLNDFYLHDVSELIASAKPALAIHGHTHESVDVTVGPTRFVCNPYGYEGHEVNAKFNPSLTVTL